MARVVFVGGVFGWIGVVMVGLTVFPGVAGVGFVDFSNVVLARLLVRGILGVPSVESSPCPSSELLGEAG